MSIEAVAAATALAAPVAGGEEFSLISLFLRADLVVKAVMSILVLMSVWSWAIIFDKWSQVGGMISKAKQFEEAFWSGQPLDDMADRIGNKPADAMARVFASVAREWRDSRKVQSSSPIQVETTLARAERSMMAASDREIAKAESGLGTLATIGSASPFIGLFGTVWGIMNAFRSIAAARETNLAVVAPGIAEALFATALGLVAAIPAVMAYNKFATDVGKFADRLSTFSNEFLVRLSRRLTERAD